MMNMNNLAQTHEILTPQLATKVGLTKFEFYKYVKANEYEQVGHGVYAAKDTWIDELEMLHRRCPMGVFSHDEAFYYYGLTDREPLVHTLTIYSGYNVHLFGSLTPYTICARTPGSSIRVVVLMPTCASCCCRN